MHFALKVKAITFGWEITQNETVDFTTGSGIELSMAWFGYSSSTMADQI